MILGKRVGGVVLIFLRTELFELVEIFTLAVIVM